MEFSIGMVAGSLISLITFFISINHMVSEEKKRNEPLEYDIEIKSKGKHVKGMIYLKKRRKRFNVRA